MDSWRSHPDAQWSPYQGTRLAIFLESQDEGVVVMALNAITSLRCPVPQTPAPGFLSAVRLTPAPGSPSTGITNHVLCC